MSTDTKVCTRCGRDDGQHDWIEGDCVLPHRNHSHATFGHVCKWCVERHEQWLTEIVDLYATLSDVLLAGDLPQEESAHQKPQKRPASPSPLNLAAWAMLHDSARLRSCVWNADRTGMVAAHGGANLPDVPTVLHDWAQALLDGMGWTSTAPDTVSGAAAVLRANAEDAAVQPWVDEYDAELRWVRRSLRSAHGVSNPAPLGRCLSIIGGKDCAGMVWPNPGKMPSCSRCDRHYGTADLVRLRIMEDAS